LIETLAHVGFSAGEQFSAGESTTSRPTRRLGRNTATWRIFSARVGDKPKHGEMVEINNLNISRQQLDPEWHLLNG